MEAKILSTQGEEKVLRILKEKSRERRRILCVDLGSYSLTPIVEGALRKAAEADDIVGVRKAARKALLSHWARSRGHGPKSASDEIKGHLASHGITRFYHLTAKTNLDSIHATGGLLSRATLARRGIQPTCIADRERDDACGTDEWVHLCLHPNQPMFYRLIPQSRHNEFLILEVSVEAALWGSTVFSDENAIAGYARLGPDLSDLQKLDLKCFADGKFVTETKKAWQAEVLVHLMLPIDSITQIRSYADVLEEHRSSVPMGAKLDFLNRQSGN